jgi:hypothetical protein
VLIPTESRFDRTPDGACRNVGSSSYEFWQRYLDDDHGRRSVPLRGACAGYCRILMRGLESRAERGLFPRLDRLRGATTP